MNSFDLSAIASLGSAVSLIVFLVVGLAGLRLRAETGSSAPVIILTLAATSIVLVLFAIDDTARNGARNVHGDDRPRPAGGRPRPHLEAAAAVGRGAGGADAADADRLSAFIRCG